MVYQGGVYWLKYCPDARLDPVHPGCRSAFYRDHNYAITITPIGLQHAGMMVSNVQQYRTTLGNTNRGEGVFGWCGGGRSLCDWADAYPIGRDKQT